MVDQMNTSRFAISGIDPENLVTDAKTGLVWQQNLSVSTYNTWQQALDYCTNLGHGGQSARKPHPLYPPLPWERGK